MEHLRLAYTVSEAADALRVSSWLVREQCRRGRLRHIRIGQRIVIPRQALEELLADQEGDGMAPDAQ